jgi:hypothetical protein
MVDESHITISWSWKPIKPCHQANENLNIGVSFRKEAGTELNPPEYDNNTKDIVKSERAMVNKVLNLISGMDEAQQPNRNSFKTFDLCFR